MQRASCAGLLTLWTATGLTARAADAVDPFTERDESELLRAEERVVTVASRYAQTVARASSIVTVVTAAEMRERGLRSLADVLSTIPGIYIPITEDGRKLAWVRGVTSSDNNKILLLVDGIPWYDGLYNHAWIDEYLPLQTVRQVEVIRGPASASYGTNAFAAVINVVTYSARDLKGGFVRGEAGTFGHEAVTAVFGDRVGEALPVGVRVYARALRSDGDGLDVMPDGTHGISGDAPRQAIGAGLQLDIARLTLRFDHVNYQHDALVSAQDDTLDVLLADSDTLAYRYRDDFLAARYELRPGPWVRLTTEGFAQLHDDPSAHAWLESDDEDETSWDMGLVESERRTGRYGAALRGELRPWLDHITVLAVGVAADDVLEVEDTTYDAETGLADSDGFYAPSVRLADLYGYGQHQWAPTWWLELYAGARVDRRSLSCAPGTEVCALPTPHTALSPRAGFSLAPDAAVSLKASYSRAFRSPNARELLVVTDPDEEQGLTRATASNPDLAPEVLDVVEAEVLAHPLRPLTLRVDGFAGRLRDEIGKSTSADSETGQTVYENQEGSNLLGAEAEATLDLNWLELWAAWSWVYARDLETDREVYGFPPNIGHARATWKPIPQARFSVLGDFVDRRPQAEWSPDAGAADGARYALMHLAIATDGLAKGRVRADISVRNVLDTAYTRPLPRDEINATKEVPVDDVRYPEGTTTTAPAYLYGLEGEERRVVVGLEVTF